MNLSCPACSAPFSADDTHADLGIANCRTCRGVLDLRAANRPLSVPCPPRFTVEEDSQRLTISWRWMEGHHLLALALLLVAATGAYTYCGAAIDSGDWSGMLDPLLLGFCTLLGALSYAILAGLCNRTRVTVDGAGELTITFAPFPWPRERVVPAREIVQLFVRELEGGPKTKYFLAAIDTQGRRVDLAGELAEYDEAYFLERRLERRLGIHDRAVDGEALR